MVETPEGFLGSTSLKKCGSDYLLFVAFFTGVCIIIDLLKLGTVKQIKLMWYKLHAIMFTDIFMCTCGHKFALK